MVAEVSSLIRLMKGSGVTNESSSSAKSTALITRDLLGGCCSSSSTIDSKELDLDLHVPSGWEKRLDLKSGKVYLERSNYSTSSTMVLHNKQRTNNNQTVTAKLPLSVFEDTKLELKLLPSSSSLSGNYHSVCTLDKVKSALKRAEKELSTTKRKISSISSSSTTSNYSNSSISSSSIHIITDEDRSSSSSNSLAAGCPSCLIYVLISKTNPRCPRCNTMVPILPHHHHHVGMKKPRIDLNLSI